MSHPQVSRVIMTERVNGGSPRENLEVIVGENGVMVKLSFEKVKEGFGG